MKRLTVFAFLVLTSACAAKADDPNSSGGGASTDGTPPPAPGATKTGTTPSPSQPAGGGGTPSGGDPSQPATPTPDPKPSLKNGTITITQSSSTVGATTTPTYSAMASFIDATGAVIPAGMPTCTTSTENGCDLTACDLPKAAPAPTTTATTPPPATPPKMPTAGDIKVTSLEDLTLSPDANGLYAPKSGQSQFFTTGQTIDINAVGADVPAFQKTITAPSRISVTGPTWPALGTPLAIDRSQDFVLTWDNTPDPGGAATGDVQVTISTISTDKMASMVCKFSVAGGTATIPAATMGKLVATSTGSISVDTRATDSVDASDWHITTVATRPARVGKSFATGIASVK
jgi:hypothetical protein